MTLNLIDIGANLSHDSFKDDLNQVILDAHSNGIDKIMLTGTCIDSSREALDICIRYDDCLYSTVGIHPHDATKFSIAALSELKELAQHKKVKAIGETGLDFNRDFSPRDKQETAFAAQLGLAVDLQMPVFLHERDAHQRFQSILKEYRDQLPSGVVHCFTGDHKELQAYLDLDMHIGITGWVCDERRGQHLHSLLKYIPRNRLMLETDSPYLLPRSIKPKPKSRRNTPGNLVYVLATVAACLSMTEIELARQTTQNAKDFFDL